LPACTHHAYDELAVSPKEGVNEQLDPEQALDVVTVTPIGVVDDVESQTSTKYSVAPLAAVQTKVGWLVAIVPQGDARVGAGGGPLTEKDSPELHDPHPEAFPASTHQVYESVARLEVAENEQMVAEQFAPETP